MRFTRTFLSGSALAGLALAAVLASSMYLGLAVKAQAADTVPAVGSNAPEFTLPSQEGKPVSLKDYRGKWVVLYFYPKDFTKGCTIEAHNFERDIKQYEAKKTVVLGVSVDSVDSHQEFCTKEGLSFKLLSDSTANVVSQYGSKRDNNGVVMAQRNTFVINPKGQVAKAYVGVDPEKHSEELLAALTELQK